MSCYHRSGRTKKAWACPHNFRIHYSKGLCQNCYLASYYQERKAKKQLKPRKAKGGTLSSAKDEARDPLSISSSSDEKLNEANEVSAIVVPKDPLELKSDSLEEEEGLELAPQQQDLREEPLDATVSAHNN